eukprot:m.948982 g.948982  ORF g.948982 m.948982 type:complete len:542 (+) comp23851_c2_seq28:354-1979(+)
MTSFSPEMDSIIAYYNDQIDNDIVCIEDRLRTWTSLESEYAALISKLKDLPDKTRYSYKIPMGKKAFMLGELVHTNEITVLLGDNYFVERSAKQALAIAERRIRDVSTKVEHAKKEMERMTTRKTMAGMLREELPGESGAHGLIAQADGTFDIREPLSDDATTDEDDVDDDVCTGFSASKDILNHPAGYERVHSNTSVANEPAVVLSTVASTDALGVQTSASDLGLDFNERPNICKAPQRWLHLDHSDTLLPDADMVDSCDDISVFDKPNVKPEDRKQEHATVKNHSKSLLTSFMKRLDELERLEKDSDPTVSCADDPCAEPVDEAQVCDPNANEASAQNAVQIFLGTEENSNSTEAVHATLPTTDIRISHTRTTPIPCTPLSQHGQQPGGSDAPGAMNPANTAHVPYGPIETPADIYSQYGSEHNRTGPRIASATPGKSVRFEPAVATQPFQAADTRDDPATGMAVGNIVERGVRSSSAVEDCSAARDADALERQADVAAIHGRLADMYLAERLGTSGSAPQAAPPQKMSLFMQRRMGLE